MLVFAENRQRDHAAIIAIMIVRLYQTKSFWLQVVYNPVMNAQIVISEFKKFCQTNFGQERAKKEKAYLYSELKHYGLSFGLREKFLRDNKQQLIQLSKKEVLTLVKLLWQQPSFEERMLALDILVLHKDKLTPADLPLLETLMRASKGWALLDNFIIQVMPHLLSEYPQTYNVLKKWIKDDDFWVRRSALLSQLLFFRQGKDGDKDLFFQMAADQLDESWIDKLYKDKLQNKRAKFFIRKAIGWTLREMSRKHPQTVVDFVKKYQHQMSGLTRREATRKLPAKYSISTVTI